MDENILPPLPIPKDDLSRTLTIADPDDTALPHIGLVGNTYTVLVSGKDTAGRFCVIDMLIAPEGGPAPHRHDFEETFMVVEGEIEAQFRGEKSKLHAGQTINIPANAPHSFKNVSGKPARLICICSPAGQEEFFGKVGVAVPTRTSPPPKPSKEEMETMKQKAIKLAPQYRTEMLS